MSDKTLRRRSEIPVEDQWKLEDMFPSDAAWETEVEQVYALCEEIKKMKGSVGKDAHTLLGFLKKQDELELHLLRCYVYANQRWHQDMSDAKYQGMAAKADSFSVAADEALSFGVPEILEIPEAKLEEYMQQEEGLSHYRRLLEEILRKKEHVLSKEEEAILSAAGELAVGPSNVFSMFNNADVKFPSVTDVEGNRIRITHGNFISLIESKDRGLRKHAFEGLYHTYEKWGNTIAATFLAHLKQESFFARMRKYQSVRAMHLNQGNIPEAVYDNLIETVHKHLPAMHRYVAARKKILGVDKLHMYDLYVPLVESVDTSYTFEEAKELVAKGLAPMGEEYLSILQEGFSNGWIDIYENENKRSGAYSWGAYGTHPYVLLNYQGNLDNVFTLAHEMGHAIHTYYSSKNQPITYHNYLIFVAEVASTCNEALLMQYMLSEEKDEEKKRYLVNHNLESFRATLFRQTMFAEFEKIVHDKLAKGENLTQEALNAIYHDLNVMYFGPDIIVDEEIDREWMRIPHFYTSFYVYQYATGYSAAIAFSKKILEEGAPAVERYVKNFLSGGCSKDPIDLLKSAGVDISTPQPVEDALNVFEEYLSLFESQI